MAKQRELTEEQRQELLEHFREKYPRPVLGGGSEHWFIYPLGDVSAYEGHVDKAWNRETRKYVPGKVHPPRVWTEECPFGLDDWRLIPEQTLPRLNEIDEQIADVQARLQALEDARNAILQDAFARGERVSLETARAISQEKRALRESMLAAERAGR